MTVIISSFLLLSLFLAVVDGADPHQQMNRFTEALAELVGGKRPTDAALALEQIGLAQVSGKIIAVPMFSYALCTLLSWSK
jgi:hypothetical protein